MAEENYVKLFPLSKPQQAIWNMEQFYGGSIASVTGSIIFNMPVAKTDLIDALNKITLQCDSLRLRIKFQEGTPMQYVEENRPFEIETVRFKTLVEFERWATNLAKTPIDINGTLCKLYIVTTERKIGVVLYMHHLVSDAWTMGLLADIIIKNLKGEPVNTYSYLDFLFSQREYEYSARREKDRVFFLSRFEKIDEPAYLSDKQARSTESERISLMIDYDSTVKIKEFCKYSGVTPYTLFITSLATYIYRIKGANNVYIGTAVINRSGRRENNTAGMFVNTIPVLVGIDEDKHALDILLDNSAEISSVFRHQKYQYVDLLGDLREKHGFAGRLYDVVLSYQNILFDNDNVTAQWHFTGCQSEGLNIHVNDRMNEGVYHFDYTYQTELFSEHDIKRMHEHLSNIILDTIENPKKKPHELKLFRDEEYKRVVFGFNNTAVDYPKDKCIHQLFERQASKTPEAVAVIFEDKEYTYRQVNEMANSLARILRGKGVGRNDIVAIVARRSYKIIVAQLAVLKAGGAYLPIDPSYPIDRISFMLEDARCKIALVLGAEVENVNVVDMDSDDIFNCDTGNLEKINTSDDLCYVIFTSGSTGEPKGVMITHRNLVNFCDYNKYNLLQTTVFDYCHSVLAIGAVTFDITLFEIALSLLYGLRIVYANEVQCYSGDFLATLIEKYVIDCIHITPTQLHQFIQDLRFAMALNKVKVFMVGGEILSDELAGRIHQYTKARIFNGYGPTETTLGVCFGEVKNDITIGKPIANTQIYILDKHLNPLPIGVTGELCIAGACVGKGYLNRPDLTAEKFIDNPFGEEKMYKTGDLAKWREDGNLEYIGRIDNQVKIRGLRIELGEIEAEISNCKDVKQIAVVVRNDDSGRQFICAYYSGEGVDIKAIKGEISKALPQYMIPHIFIQVEQLPTTPNGKTDRRALPTPDFSQMKSDAEYITPVTESEKVLVQILESVLGVSPIGIADNFFDLGGDSLKAIEFIAQAQDAGFDLSAQDVFNNPTISALLRPQANNNPLSAAYAVSEFTKYEPVLNLNVIDEHKAFVKKPIGNLFLTGVTGFFGAHILDEYLKSEVGIAYCLVRGKDLEDSRKRLDDTLSFYFGERYKSSERIVAVCGDIMQEITYGADIQTVIHSAANVKHYGEWRDFFGVNVQGTKNIIDFAKAKSARLLHISTMSVSGNAFFNETDTKTAPLRFNEHCLFVGQHLENVYARSKFEAESAVLEAITEGLYACIARVGNLSNRHCDGIFQRNYGENATLSRLRSFIDVGIIPDYLLKQRIEFSPVDFAANAIIKIAQYNERYSIFHAYNDKSISFETLIGFLSEMGVSMRTASETEFAEAVKKAAGSPDTKHIYEAFAHDRDKSGRLAYTSNIEIDNSFTSWFLSKVGFHWSGINLEYLTNYVKYFRNIGYLEV